MNKIKVSLFLALTFAINISYAERIISTQYFNNFAIQEVDNYDVGPPTRMERKVIVYKIKKSLENTNPTPSLGEIVWTIMPQALPANADTCLKENIDTCEVKEITDNPFEGCFKSCIHYGPSLLNFDEKNQKIYLLAGTVEVGQGGGPHLGFVADLKSKTIKYLKVFAGFIDGKISPNGKYILLEGRNRGLGIYNTESNQEKSLELKPITNLRWINNNEISYQIIEESNSNKLSAVITKNVGF